MSPWQQTPARSIDYGLALIIKQLMADNQCCRPLAKESYIRLCSFLTPFHCAFQDVCSRSPSIISLKTAERFVLELKKSSGGLGISVAVSQNSPLSEPTLNSAIEKKAAFVWKAKIQQFLMILEDFRHL